MATGRDTKKPLGELWCKNYYQFILLRIYHVSQGAWLAIGLRSYLASSWPSSDYQSAFDVPSLFQYRYSQLLCNTGTAVLGEQMRSVLLR